jgi:HAMP domain-containing protein
MSTDTSPPRGDTPSGRTLTKFAEDAHLLVSLSAGGELRPRLGLGGRLFLGAVILLAATLGLAIAFSTRQARRVAEETILADLKTMPTMYEGYRDSQASARRRQVRSLAEEPGTKALLGEVVGHAETFRDTAADFAKALGAGTVFFFDPRGVLIARSDRGAGEEAGRDFSQVAWVRDPVAKLQDATAFILELRGAKRLSLVAAAPVVQGEGEEMRLNGVLAAAFPVDRERAGELARITSGEVAFLANVAAREQPPRIEIVASTSRLADPVLPSRLADQAGVLSTLFERGEPFGPLEFIASGDVYIGTAVPIKSGAGEPIAALLVARSKSAELAAFERIRTGLLVVGGALLLSSLPISFVLAQGLTRPLRQLSQAAEEIGRGHLEVPVPAAAPGEVGVLARALSGMVLELQAKA